MKFLKFPEIDQQLQIQYQMISLPELISDLDHHHLDNPKSQISPLNLKGKLQGKDFKLLKSKWTLNWLKNLIKNLSMLMHFEELPTNLDKEGVSNNNNNNDFLKNKVIMIK